MKTRVSLKYFVTDCILPWEMASSSATHSVVSSRIVQTQIQQWRKGMGEEVNPVLHWRCQ